MKRTTISLPDNLGEVLEREARRRATSVSDVVREALVVYLGMAADRPRHLPFAALGNSGYRHTARDIETILEHEWAPLRRSAPSKVAEAQAADERAGDR